MTTDRERASILNSAQGQNLGERIGVTLTTSDKDQAQDEKQECLTSEQS